MDQWIVGTPKIGEDRFTYTPIDEAYIKIDL